MSDDPAIHRAEQVLRAVLADRAASLRPGADLEQRVRHHNLVRVRLLIAAAAAAAVLVGVGIPAGLAVMRADAPPVRPAPGPSPSPAGCEPLPGPQPTTTSAPARELPRQAGVRGSLAGDRALVDTMLAAGWQGLLDDRAELNRSGDRRTLAVRTLRLRFVERAGPGVLALVTAADTTGRWQAAQWVVRENGRVRPTGGPGGIVDSEDFERRQGSLFSGAEPLFVSSQRVCGGMYGVVLAPPDATAEITPPPSVSADARLVTPPARALPLRDGLAVFPAGPAAGSQVAVSRDHARLGLGRIEGGLAPASRVLAPAELARIVREAPGEVDQQLVESVLRGWALNLGRVVADQVTGARVLWAGRLHNGHPVLLAALDLPSGASYVASGEGDGGDGHGGYGVSMSYGGLLPAGRLDDTVFSWQDAQYVVVVATKATRAEVVLPGGDVLPVPLAEGGGSVIVPKGVKAQLVRAYGADGDLIGERAPDTGLLPLPGP